ncbi:MAG: 4Fe-4S binding protein [Lentisphaerae bacterium]|nr:4Fe-4S binding protein [Lentisphaerota bacterium]
METINFTLDREKCIRCNACVKDCTRHIIHSNGGYPEIPAAEEKDCIRCQHCMAICPTGAISILGLLPENSLPVETVAPDAMSRFVRSRRTVRQYRKENVDRALIDKLLADTAHAPTGGNTCDLTFSVIDGRKEISRIVAALMDHLSKSTVELSDFMRNALEEYQRSGADEIFRDAPHLLIVSAGEKAYCGDADVVIAVSYFELLAQAHGLGTTWCYFLKFILNTFPELGCLFGISTERPFCPIAFGLPAIQYARTVQRDQAATIKTIKFDRDANA